MYQKNGYTSVVTWNMNTIPKEIDMYFKWLGSGDITDHEKQCLKSFFNDFLQLDRRLYNYISLLNGNKKLKELIIKPK